MYTHTGEGKPDYTVRKKIVRRLSMKHACLFISYEKIGSEKAINDLEEFSEKPFNKRKYHATNSWEIQIREPNRVVATSTQTVLQNECY